MDITLLHGKHLKALIDGHRDNLFREYVKLKPIKLCRGISSEEIVEQSAHHNDEEVIVGFKPGTRHTANSAECNCFDLFEQQKEKIVASREVVELLSSIMEHVQPSHQVVQELEPKWDKMTADYVEEFPLLLGQCDADMDAFDLFAQVKHVPLKTQVALGKRKFRIRDLNKEEGDSDKGLRWSKRVKDEIELWARDWERERLTADMECAGYLNGIITFGSKEGLKAAEEKALKEYGKWTKPERRSITPLLFFATPKNSAYIAPLQDLKLLEEDIRGVTTQDLLEEFTNEIIAEDQLTPVEELEQLDVNPAVSHSLHASSPLIAFAEPPSAIGNLKEDIPITLASSPFCGRSQGVFELVSTRFSKIPRSEDISLSEDDQRDFIENVIKPQALEFIRQSDQEQLQEEDSTLRECVPVMDFSLPEVPWDRKNLEREWMGSAGKQWLGAISIQLDLVWDLYKRDFVLAALEEKVDEEGVELAQFIAEFIISDEGIRKAEDEATHEARAFSVGKSRNDLITEFLELQGFPNQVTDIDTLVAMRKRKRSEALRNASEDSITKRKSIEVPLRYCLDSEFSAVDNVHAFMVFRNAKAKKGISKGIALSTAPTISVPPVSTLAVESAATGAIPAAALAREIRAVETGVTFPTPVPQPVFCPIDLPSSPGTFIASTSLLSQIHLYKFIYKLYPTANILERDFISVFVAPEADLIISTTTGLIVTTFQKIRQKVNLPGEADEKRISGIRDQIWDLTQRYEKLIVVIQNKSLFEGQELMSERDKKVIEDFEEFVRHLGSEETGLDEADVIPLLMHGDEMDVAKCVVGCMIEGQLEMDQKGCKLKGMLGDEESQHEVTLRSAGFNAYAAQVVLSECAQEAKLTTDDGDVVNFFLSMDPEWRILKFGGIVGERVVRRVNWQVEQWRRAKEEAFARVQ